MIFEPLPVTITYAGSLTIVGHILKINPTGLLVELDKIPFALGQELTVAFHLDGVNQSISAPAKPIKNYDNYRKRIKVETDKGPVVETKSMKLSELHFVRSSEATRSAIMKYLMDLQVNLMKKGQ